MDGTDAPNAWNHPPGKVLVSRKRCFVNDAHGAYDILKEAIDLIPIEPRDLSEEEPAPDKPNAK